MTKRKYAIHTVWSREGQTNMTEDTGQRVMAETASGAILVATVTGTSTGLGYFQSYVGLVAIPEEDLP